MNEYITRIIRFVVMLLGWLILSLFAISHVAVADGFQMMNLGTHKVPMPDDYAPTVMLPNTQIKAGIFDYDTAPGLYIHRLGFLIDSDKFSYVYSEGYDISDVHYGLFANYFVVDGWGWGSTSGHDRLMLLCQFDNSSIKLLDVINESTMIKGGTMDFVSVSNNRPKPGQIEMNPAPSWTKIEDIDGDGVPEIKLQILGFDFFLYMEIRDGHFQVNFNAKLYASLFERAKGKAAASKFKRPTYAYYIYGVLSKKLAMADVKSAQKRGERRAGEVIPLLEKIGDWDTAFHNLDNEHFIMKKLEIKGQ